MAGLSLSQSSVQGQAMPTGTVTLTTSARASGVDRYIWTYWTAGAIGHTTAQAGSALQLDTECRFFDNARGGDDASGNRYIQMTVALVLQDRNNVRTSPVRRVVRLYPNRLCGFTY